MNYIDVIVPLPLDATFTYSVPDKLMEQVSVGCRVVVPFGKRKFYTGIVTSLTALPPTNYEVKNISRVLDPKDEPVLLHPQLRFWNWISTYYLCTEGEVMRAALPSGLKLESETFVEANCEYDFTDATSELSDQEAILLMTLAQSGRMTLGDLVRKTGLSASPEKLIDSLINRGMVSISEKVVERYRTLTQTFVSLPEGSKLPGWRASAFATVQGAPKQERLLLAMLQLAAQGTTEIERAQLLAKSDCSAVILKALESKGLVKIHKKEVNRFNSVKGVSIQPVPKLSDAQNVALQEIIATWKDQQKAVTLLRGVTSSGKTEIYVHLIERALRDKLQVLYLVPEIALTTQLTSRLQRVFGSKVVVYHSKFTDNERVDLWRKIRSSSEPMVVIGARSAVFLPFHNLGLVIVDEEHEPSYKQFDPAPRYNARDAAIVLASMHGAKTLLGSASPSVETYFKALSGRYGLVELTERFGGVNLPEIEIVDLKKEWRKHPYGGTQDALTPDVQKQISASVSEGKQAIVFLNRRGFAPIARCRQCAHIPKCMNCDVSLTYHRHENKLICHYCGASYPLPTLCPVCREPAIEIIGHGTERVEEEVERQFPDARIMRMDLDTTRNKDGYQEIINAFSAHKADILVGTQMVTKGLDFQDVNIVAVVSADAMINLPDFRSSERAFNMLLQVAGRAGRRDTTGKVVIQTAQPDNPVISYVAKHDYNGFYKHELEERKERFYPPFSRMIFIYLKHRDENTVQTVSEIYGSKLRQLLGTRVNGPDKPAVSRIQSLHIRRFMLKVEPEASMAKVKELLRKLFAEMHSNPVMRGTQIHYDVDPA